MSTYAEYRAGIVSEKPAADSIIVTLNGAHIWATPVDPRTKIARIANNMIFIGGIGWVLPQGEVMGPVEAAVMEAAHAEALAMCAAPATARQAAPAQRLAAATGFDKVRATSECGEELRASGSALSGLACSKSAGWRCPDGITRCAQHAAVMIH